ncbi:hypothetical protein [Pseudomonas amygdali]|uniref:Uncharacterized protein n=2 Tax=Pseudomonas amygdali pv. lachrymans TaxID=53707 RepID=A0ABR5KQJ1_PSEAV|nr:hypothetical protein [Pseudomonas amygdali]AXH59594.1 hypothetical protein PLA107_030690 [Pseudomonas amygdali pv. lachrymans str. M301315]KPC17023.1 Uncharacterized protein AC499_0225 [Pseudomonas amygdali pv. lachrymans]KPC17982.1 Uncharacterized protein AC499_1184 [Pseudomonas amygdali pv. lachrymans]
MNVSAADEQAYLKQQVLSQLSFMRAFDAEIRQSILRLHEPQDGMLMPAQIDQLIKMKGRLTTVLAMTSVQIFGQAKDKTTAPVVEAKLALELGAVSGEMEQILGRIGDLHKVLSEMPLEAIRLRLANKGPQAGVLWLGDHLKVQGYGKGMLYERYLEGVTKLVMFNIYGKSALLDLYPEKRKTIEEIRHDFKHHPLEADTW